MEVILQQDVEKLGAMGDVVKVKPGYARNYLLPRGLAVIADPKNLAMLEHRKRVVGAKRLKVQKSAQAVAERLAAVSVVIPARAGEEDRLFGSVTNQDIQRALVEQGFEIDRRKIFLEAPIKTLGEFTVPINLGTDVRASIKVTIVREE